MSLVTRERVQLLYLTDIATDCTPIPISFYRSVALDRVASLKRHTRVNVEFEKQSRNVVPVGNFAREPRCSLSASLALDNERSDED